MMTTAWLNRFLGQLVVADLDHGYLVLGRLEAADDAALEFADADLHDHGEANCTKEVYVLESRSLGVRANRRRVVVPAHRLIALSLLDEVTA